MSEPKKYVIGDRTFVQQPLTWKQLSWVRDHVGLIGSMGWDQIYTTLADKAPLFFAICFVEETMTREDKVKLGFGAIATLRDYLEIHMDPGMVLEVAKDFFSLNPRANLWMLFDPKQPSPPAAAQDASEIGSLTVLSSSPTGT